MKSCKITIYDEVYCTISGLTPQDQTFLYNHFGIEVEGAFFMPAVKLGRWDGKIRFYEQTGRTYVRILDEIVPFLYNWGYDISIEDNRFSTPLIEGRMTLDRFSHIVTPKGPIEFRPYQVEAVNEMISASSGFVVAGTGSGKTFICAGACDIYSKNHIPTITIVPSGDLVDQTADTYRLLELDEVGVYSGAQKDIGALNLVATWQSLQNNPYIMHDYGMVLIDEAHGAKAKVIQQLVNEHGAHIPFRFGVTGTFPKPETDQYTLKSTIGSILYTITARELINMGYLAEVEIQILQTMDSADLPDYTAEKTYLGQKEDRIDLLAELIQEHMEEYGNTLVLVNSLKFGRMLQKKIPNSIFMSGDTDKNTRKDNYNEYDTRNDVIKIATYGIASTGISIDRIFCLFMVDAGKSFVKAIQTIGRGTRLADDKNKVHVVDFCSTLKYSKKHLKERKKYYKEAEYKQLKPKKVKY